MEKLEAELNITESKSDSGLNPIKIIFSSKNLSVILGTFCKLQIIPVKTENIHLSAAYDIVRVYLLMKRLTLLGQYSGVLRLIKTWLSNRSYYVNINGRNSEVILLNSGTKQGSMLGPIIYAIYVSPLFD